MRSGGMAIFRHDDPDSLHLTHDFNAVVWSPDGRYIVGGHDDGFMRIWDVRRPNGAWVRKVKAHADWVESLAFLPDGKGLVSGSEDATVKYWNVDWLGVFCGGLRGPDGKVERTGEYTGRTAELATPLHEFLGHKVRTPS
jgi:WD40 repeat protein